MCGLLLGSLLVICMRSILLRILSSSLLLSVHLFILTRVDWLISLIFLSHLIFILIWIVTFVLFHLILILLSWMTCRSTLSPLLLLLLTCCSILRHLIGWVGSSGLGRWGSDLDLITVHEFVIMTRISDLTYNSHIDKAVVMSLNIQGVEYDVLNSVIVS